MREYYEIKVRSHLDLYWSNWFENMTLTHLIENETLIAGWLPDQAALHSILERIRNLNLTLISVTCNTTTNQPSSQEDQTKNENQ